MGDISLHILIKATDQASAIFGQVGSAAQSSLGGMVVGAAATAGIALAGLGIKAVQTAADFQESMLRVQALAGVSATEAKAAEAAIMQMSVNVGQAPKTLAEGLYYIASAGYNAKDSLNLLELSSKAAAVGNTQTEVTANALTAAMKAFNVPASDASKVMDMMVKTVSTGKTEFEDYAKIIGKVSLNAKQSGITFAEANAAFATLTNVMPSSKQAADSLNALLQTSSRFDLLSNRASSLGIAFDTNAYKTMNLQQRMQYLMQITDGDSEAMTKLLGRSNAMAAATALATGNFEGYNTALQSVTNNQGALEAAFEKTSSGFNASVARLKASFDVVLITLGNQLLPIATNVVNAITPLVTAFSQIGSASSPLAPIIASISGMFTVMGSNWTDLASRSQPLVQAFTQFGQLMGQLMPGFVSQFLVIMAEVNLVLVSIAEAVSQWAVPGFQILGQIFQNAQTQAEPIINAIRGQLVPALQNLIAAIAPVITGILQWIASSGIIPTIMAGISIAIQVVVTVVSFLVNILATLITFFTQNMVGIAIFRAVLVILAVAIGLIGIVILAIVIPAFIAWVIGAIAVGIANIIAFAPIILIVLAIVAVVTIVILIIMNWGAIASWLGGVWQAFVSWFMGAMAAMGAFFSGLWAGIVSGAQGAWNSFVSWLMGVLSAIGGFVLGIWAGIVGGIQAAWNGIVSFFQGLWAGIIGIFQNAVNTVVGWFAWLYAHNYYFQALVDTIIGIITGVVAWLTSTWQGIVRWITMQWAMIQRFAQVYWTAAMIVIQMVVNAVVGWLQGIWNGIVSFLTGLWNGIVGVATTAWNAVTGAISTAINAAVTWLQGIWTNVTTWLSDTWNNLVKGATDLWNQISTVFATAWDTYIVKPLTDLYNSLVEWASGLVTAALDWGKNLIQGFIDGILGMLANVGEAAKSIVAEIGKFLGFHSPAEAGPGAEADQWAPNFIAMYAQGLTDGAKQIQVASQQLMLSMQLTFQKGFEQLNVIVIQGVTLMTQTLSLSWTSMIAATTVGMQQIQLAMQQGWTQVNLSLMTSLQQLMLLFTTWWLQLLLLWKLQMIKLTTQLQLDWKKIQTDLQAILKLIEADIKKAWDAILAYLKSQQKLIETAMTTPFKNAQTQIKSIMQQISSDVSSQVSSMISKLKSVESAASSAKAAVASVPSVPGGPNTQSFASGIEQFAGGLAYVHEKEVLVNLSPGTSVVPANRVSFGKGAGTGATITNYITITVPRGRTDVEDIADEVSRVLAREFKGLLSTISTGGTSI